MNNKHGLNKLKWMLIFGSILWMTISFSGCSTVKYKPTDGIVYSGGTMMIIQSNGQQVIIKK